VSLAVTRYPAGESYLDVIQRLEPVIIEMEREREYVLVVGHQAILRAIYGYFMAVPLKDIPPLDMPLHTLIGESPVNRGQQVLLNMPLHTLIGESPANRGQQVMCPDVWQGWLQGRVAQVGMQRQPHDCC